LLKGPSLIALSVTIALGGLGLYYLFNKQKKALFTHTRKPKIEYFNVGRDFDDIKVPMIHKHRNVLHKIGWTIPFTHQLGEDRFPPAGSVRVSNDSYSVFDDTAREDGFAGGAYAFAGSMIPSTPYSSDSLPVNSTDPVLDAAIADTDSVPSIIVDPHALTPKVIDLQNQILKMIIANTTSVNVILSNIDTIKQSISTYRHKLRLVYEQVQNRNITPIQLQQYLMQVISDISTQLQLPLSPQFTLMMNQSPFSPVLSLV
jgi:hypothetical protein